MLERVSRYVIQLTKHSRLVKTNASIKYENAMRFIESLSVHGGMKVPVDERGIDALISSKYK